MMIILLINSIEPVAIPPCLSHAKYAKFAKQPSKHNFAHFANLARDRFGRNARLLSRRTHDPTRCAEEVTRDA